MSILENDCIYQEHQTIRFKFPVEDQSFFFHSCDADIQAAGKKIFWQNNQFKKATAVGLFQSVGEYRGF